MFNKRHTTRSKQKQRKAKLGEANPMWGKTHTDATKAVLSEDTADRVWIFHPFDGTRRVKRSELRKYLADGWVRGRSFNAL